MAAAAGAEETAQLHAILAGLPQALLAIDADYRILFANPAAERLLGYGPGEMRDLPLALLSETAAMQLSGLARRETPRQILCPLARKTGGSIQLRIEGRPLRRDGAEALLLLHEGAERQPGPEPVPAGSQLAILGQIAAGLAQELEQPLSVIRMASENTLSMVEDGETDPGFLRGQLGLVAAQAQRMSRIVDHVRVFARIERIEPVAFDVGESAAAALALVERDFRRCGLRAELAVQACCPRAFGLPLRLEQVLVHLFTNARDAILENPAGLPGSDQPCGEVRVSVEPVARPGGGPGQVAIRVADTGPGIPERYLSRIFDPFFTTKPADRGTGLGLTICAALVADMGGSIAARNGEAGAEFVVLMPAAATTTGDARPDLPI